MNGFLIRLLANALALLLIDQLVPGMELTGFLSALSAAFLWGLVNAVLRPFLNILAAPINFLTMGLFSLVINGALLFIVSQVVRGFSINFGAAVLVAILLSLFSTILNLVLKN
ncbi:MAG: phage holin family protein [Firmicutes bacterium]|jgi:putative membrane protein|nr:phage holin family protein [Bacillota bacterium]HOB21243.1 phage holin family protein [Bacillota bacterium]